MRAILYEHFAEPPRLTTVADPVVPAHGALVEVRASGVCRSDWHAWMGHDPDIVLPHVPGHEFAGIVREVGSEVRTFGGGERVTAPFVDGCGDCPECRSGEQQVCRRQTQPGFTHWGSFAQFVVVHHADVNLVRLPDELGFAAAASLGCRFATAFRALVDQGHVTSGQWVAVHGCGGLGLSAVMIAEALGAHVVATDLQPERLALAHSLGAEVTIEAGAVPDVAEAVIAASGDGAHVSIDAVGSAATCAASVRSLRRQGRHLQVGLLLGERAIPDLPLDRVIAHELRIIGSHGMQAHRYGAALALITSGRLDPARLLGDRLTLEGSIGALMDMDGGGPGVAVITDFGGHGAASAPRSATPPADGGPQDAH